MQAPEPVIPDVHDTIGVDIGINAQARLAEVQAPEPVIPDIHDAVAVMSPTSPGLEGPQPGTGEGEDDGEGESDGVGVGWDTICSPKTLRPSSAVIAAELNEVTTAPVAMLTR